MLVTTDVAHDGRVLREAAALTEAGHRVRIIGRNVPTEWVPPAGIRVDTVGGGQGLRPRNEAGASADSSVGRAARWLLLPEHRGRVWRKWARGARALAGEDRFDVVHAHDFNTLPLAARLADEQRSGLVYDAHEWWSGRQRHGRPTPCLTWRESRRERALVRRADAVLTVSHAIADRLALLRGGPVSVVRNTFARSGGTVHGEAKEPRAVVYAGRLGGGRDLETVVAGTAAARMGLVLMGSEESGYLGRLRPADAAHEVEILPSVPVDEVDPVLRAHGVCAVPLSDSCDNHRYALPNKLFQAVRAGVPVVAANLPALRSTVERYRLGELYTPGDPRSFEAALARVVENYQGLRASVAAAGPELCWERDAATLTAVYAGMAVRRGASA